MKRNIWMPMILAAAWSLLAVIPAAHGGYYWEMTEVQEGMPMPEGMPANLPKAVKDQFARKTETTVRHYLSEEGYRIEHDEAIVITDYRSMTVYSIQPSEKSFIKIDVQNLGLDREEMSGMAQAMNNSFQVTRTDEVRKIAGYNCRKYDVSLMMGTGEFWVSKEVEAYPLMKKIFGEMGRAMAQNPMMAQLTRTHMMGDIEGFPVRTIINIMGAKTTSTLQKMEAREIEPALFKVPAGYTEAPMPGFGME